MRSSAHFPGPSRHQQAHPQSGHSPGRRYPPRPQRLRSARGLSWDILGSGRIVLRAGYSICISNATVYSALTTTGSAGAQDSYYSVLSIQARHLSPMSSRTMPVSLSSPTRSTSTSFFRMRRSIKPSCLCNRSRAAAPRSLSTIWTHTPIICPTLSTRTSISPHLACSIDNDPSYTNTPHPTWLGGEENPPLAA
jgi:hypothetical protein